jgi:hypothetical protein
VTDAPFPAAVTGGDKSRLLQIVIIVLQFAIDVKASRRIASSSPGAVQ